MTEDGETCDREGGKKLYRFRAARDMATRGATQFAARDDGRGA
jgi:hypothetical protein